MITTLKLGSDEVEVYTQADYVGIADHDDVLVLMHRTEVGDLIDALNAAVEA